VDFKKAFDSINREALWYKIRKIGASENMVSITEIMYQAITFCVNVVETEDLVVPPKRKGSAKAVV
jgi:hypothetical protein